jgi:predicted kinase
VRPLNELTAADLANGVLRRVRAQTERALGKIRDFRVVPFGSGFAFLAIDAQRDEWIGGYDARPVTQDMNEWAMHAESDRPWHLKTTWKKQPRRTNRGGRPVQTPAPFVSQHVRTISAREWIKRRMAMMDNESVVGEAALDEVGGSYLAILASMLESRGDDTPRMRALRGALAGFALALDEGVFDPYILKAVFLGGGGGSGKGFISNIMFGTMNIPGGAAIDTSLTAFGLKSLNGDDVFTHMLRKAFADPAELKSIMKNTSDPRAQAIRAQHVDRLETKRKELWIQGRLGLIIDGTAKDPTKVRTQRQMLEDMGYDTYMVFVDTSLEVALERNRNRDRVVPEEVLRHAHAQAQAAKASFSGIFGAKNCMFIDNSVMLSPQDVKTVLTPKLHRAILKFISEPLKNPVGKAWLDAMTQDMPPEMKRLVTWIGKPRGA